ncbi:hypothetical protein D7V93_32915, partial [Corallococcus llansteffanensis]
MELRTDADHLVGTAPAGGPCNLSGAEQVLTGDFQDNVFVGKVTVCQTGEACELSETYPVLLVYNIEDRALAGQVKLEVGCESAALGPHGLLVLRAETQEAPQGAPPTPPPAA